MKIVCQSCSAKYSIADDKVQGKKVFKIKCKKCGEDILVRGPEASPDADATGSHSSGVQLSEDDSARASIANIESTDAVWHTVVDGNNQGPFTVAQLQEMLASQQIDTETFV